LFKNSISKAKSKLFKLQFWQNGNNLIRSRIFFVVFNQKIRESCYMTLTRYGIREWGGGGLIAIVLLAGCGFLYRIHWALGVFPAALVVLVYFAIACFFRSPRRTLPENEDFILSPADGVVRDITVVEDLDQLPFEGKALRIGIFLSVFNVHVNRAPVKMQVVSKLYRPGKYLDARSRG
jgi:phosphatidylserine decarboxylase